MKRRRYTRRAKDDDTPVEVIPGPQGEHGCDGIPGPPCPCYGPTPYQRIKDLEELLIDLERRRSSAKNEVFNCDAAIAEAQVNLDRAMRLLKAELNIPQ